MLASLPIPLASVGIQFRTSADELAKLTEDALEVEKTWAIGCSGKEVITEFGIAQVGSIAVTTGRTRPVALEYRNGDRLTLEMCYGGSSRLREGITNIETQAGEIIAFPNTGGILCGSDHSGISFCLEKTRLRRTAHSIYGKDLIEDLSRPQLMLQSENAKGVAGSGLLFSLFGFIDSVLAESQVITEEMNLDDQLYRAYAIMLARGIHGKQFKPRNSSTLKQSILDALVDYIRANAHSNLSLTHLEEQSHYSARHLQNLFQEKFDCTPMQFVRRQRLKLAMNKLQEGSWDDSVTSIARNCGYRFTSNFSTDFLREYGVSPSVVLRASRPPRKGI